MIVLLLLADKLLILIKQDEENSKLALEFTQLMIPALIFTALLDLQRRFLTASGKPFVPMILQACALGLHAFLNWVFVPRYEVKGVAYSMIIV
jgi:multidrug resistance protein, MATE family